MQLIKLPITADFVETRTVLSWREVRFGLDSELLVPSAAPLLAARQVASDPEPTAALIELAGQSPDEPHGEIVAALAEAEPEPEAGAIERKWLYLVLAWLFERRADHADPLELVEAVYADFGYPPEIAPFVRYMPMTGPDLGSREANEARMYDHWRHYLVESAAFFADPASG
jgi:hypothetical protein